MAASFSGHRTAALGQQRALDVDGHDVACTSTVGVVCLIDLIDLAALPRPVALLPACTGRTSHRSALRGGEVLAGSSMNRSTTSTRLLA
jgi:hypothetical protein